MKKYLAVSLLHLLECMLCIEGRDGDVAAVEDVQTGCIRVDAEERVVATAGLLAGGGRADTAWAEACTGAVGGGGVVGEAEDGDVEGCVVGG